MNACVSKPSTVLAARQIQIPKTPNFKDLQGKRFGRLVVVAYAGRNKGQQGANWLCRCDCGSEGVFYGGNLRSGNTTSCGCWRAENSRLMATTHGKKHTAEYNVWCSMKQRCYDRAHKSWHDYGSRGIRVSDRWLHSFENFYTDMGPRPGPGYEIDRIDNDGDYEPENCRWVRRVSNARNKRSNRVLTHNGQSLCISEWAEILGLTESAIAHRLSRGWDMAKVLTTPLRKTRREERNG